jgi:hypothetical protein
LKELTFKVSRIIATEFPVFLEHLEHKLILNFGQSFALTLLWDKLKMPETLKKLIANAARNSC